ncbi:hypothetical protein BS78_01G275900 [Paspalum vaginatum]|nr:hypothetical protein BS78_01G275900 [Paspalum vaginatum]
MYSSKEARRMRLMDNGIRHVYIVSSSSDPLRRTGFMHLQVPCMHRPITLSIRVSVAVVRERSGGTRGHWGIGGGGMARVRIYPPRPAAAALQLALLERPQALLK